MQSTIDNKSRAHLPPLHLLQFERLSTYFKEDLRAININPYVRGEYMKKLLCQVQPFSTVGFKDPYSSIAMLCANCGNAPNKFARGLKGQTKNTCWLCGALDNVTNREPLRLCQMHMTFGPFRKCYLCRQNLTGFDISQAVPLRACSIHNTIVAPGGNVRKCCQIVTSPEDPAFHLLPRSSIKLYF